MRTPIRFYGFKIYRKNPPSRAPARRQIHRFRLRDLALRVDGLDPDDLAHGGGSGGGDGGFGDGCGCLCRDLGFVRVGEGVILAGRTLRAGCAGGALRACFSLRAFEVDGRGVVLAAVVRPAQDARSGDGRRECRAVCAGCSILAVRASFSRCAVLAVFDLSGRRVTP